MHTASVSSQLATGAPLRKTLAEQGVNTMPRWTVRIGQSDDAIVIERSDAGLVGIDIPSRERLLADRAAVEDLRRKLGAAIADENGNSDAAG
jgi:hypothetical protein